MTTRSTLIAARALVAKGWCQNAEARDEYGFETYYDDSNAAQWCALGAIRNVDGSGPAGKVAIKAIGRVINCAVSMWNDAPGRTQADVLAAFDRAIQEVGE